MIFAERLTDLENSKRRFSKGYEAYLSGQTSSYINNIENKSNLPSMAFFCICEYLEITLWIFNYDDESPLISNELIKEIRMLTLIKQI